MFNVYPELQAVSQSPAPAVVQADAQLGSHSEHMHAVFYMCNLLFDSIVVNNIFKEIQ